MEIEMVRRMIVLLLVLVPGCSCLLFPYPSETRQYVSLNGIWQFKLAPVRDPDAGFRERWFQRDWRELGDWMEMPVPSSFNDVTTNTSVRDHLGWVWYRTSFYSQPGWKGRRVIVHFDGVHYNALVWVGGTLVGSHTGGHIAFEVDMPRSLGSGPLTLVVAVNNTLTPNSIPQGFSSFPNDSYRYPLGYVSYSHDFDYFDYAGINRNVGIYVTPLVYISNIIVKTDVQDGVGIVIYDVEVEGGESDCFLTLLKEDGKSAAKGGPKCQGRLEVKAPNLWWPSGSSHRSGYLHTLTVVLGSPGSDIYRLPVGIRKLSWNETGLYINSKLVYLTGFGKHEDSDLRGRGFDPVLLVRDFSLISWIGANSVRTSHYPYSEQFLQMADRTGLIVILESPACSLKGFEQETLVEHKRVMFEIVDRHRNHPSIVMWSLANEPVSSDNRSAPYFRHLFDFVRILDSTRPLTFVTSQQINNEKAAEVVDFLCLNRYSAWYQDPGKLDLVQYQVGNEVRAWYQKYNKPVIMTEYGAGAVAGLHALGSTMWSEDYHVDLLNQHFQIFNLLRQEGVLVGEMIWNFADFNTPQEYIRPGACAKGLFTRARQPKSAAHLVRSRYLNLQPKHSCNLLN